MSWWTDAQRLYRPPKHEAEHNTMDVQTYEPPSEPLTAVDRCDGCSAAARWRLHRPPLGERPAGVLDFCGHHFFKNENALTAQGWLIAVVAEGSA